MTYYTVLGVFVALLVPYTKGLFSAWGLRWAYILGFAFTLSYLLTPIVRSWASALNVVDIPSARKIHAEPTPLMGGLAIYIAFVCAMSANFIFTTEVTGILIGSTIIAIIGLTDDVVGVGARTKLIAQIIATVIVIASGVSLILIPRAWFGSTMLNGVLTMLWIIGLTNAMNFFDGMDGLAPGLTAVISFFMGVLAFQTNQPFLGWMAIAILGVSLGFLPYNFRRSGPATIFLGDTGSTFLGFTLACLAVLGEWAHNNPIVSLTAPLLIFSVLIFDMVHTTVARFYTGKVSTFREWLEFTGKDHMHHRLAEVLHNQRHSVLFILLLASCMGLASTVLRNAGTRDALLLIAQAVVILLLVTILENVSRRRKQEGAKQQRPSGVPDEEQSTPMTAPNEPEKDAL
ncbi:undecaprenyl/decaprenyl-phosphate alpha-N-acetylglucosaminyl 1-phosphate transferase [Nitrospinae bacterium AH_259_B05_G02_I21]|nr:undecaprenyl/decaprenyl-phosphate alpha-N-acetylglucosaminyl 1-phosphate transferase [Nitrospinae bacterium AH_259_B05_G02_I21]